MYNVTRLFAAVGLLLVATQVSATSIPIANGSFESTTVPASPGYVVNPASIPSWTYGGTLNDYVQRFDSDIAFPASPGVTSGIQYFGLNTVSTNTQISQDTGIHWAPNTTYILTVAMGNRPSVIGATGVFGLSTDSTVAHFQGTPTTEDTSTITSGTWATFTDTIITGNSAPGGDIFVIVEKLGNNTANSRLQIDNVQLNAVPEPASWLLAAMAFVGAVATLRRNRKARA